MAIFSIMLCLPNRSTLPWKVGARFEKIAGTFRQFFLE